MYWICYGGISNRQASLHKHKNPGNHVILYLKRIIHGAHCVILYSRNMLSSQIRNTYYCTKLNTVVWIFIFHIIEKYYFVY